MMCAQCLANIVRDIDHTSPTNTEHDQHILPPETNVCVWCRSSLFWRRSNVPGKSPERQLIYERISPRTVNTFISMFNTNNSMTYIINYAG